MYLGSVEIKIFYPTLFKSIFFLSIIHFKANIMSFKMV